MSNLLDKALAARDSDNETIYDEYRYEVEDPQAVIDLWNEAIEAAAEIVFKHHSGSPAPHKIRKLRR